MSDFRLKQPSALLSNALSLKYETNLQSPKSFIKKSTNFKNSQTSFNKSTSNAQQQQEESISQNSFIPFANQKDYMHIWKDFRNDIRKKFQSSSIGGPLSARSNRTTSQDRDYRQDISNNDTQKYSFHKQQQPYEAQVSSQQTPINKFKEQISSVKNSDTRINYDMQRANKIQDMFQKYLKDDGSSNRNPQLNDKTVGQSQTYLKQQSPTNRASVHQSTTQPRQSSLINNKSPLHKRENSALTKSSLGMYTSANDKMNMISSSFREASKQENKRDSLLSNDASMKQSKANGLSTPFTPKRPNLTLSGLQDSIHTYKTSQSPLNYKNLANNLDSKSSQFVSSIKKQALQSSIEMPSKIGGQNKSPRVSFSVNQFSKSYKKDDISALRLQISALTVEEAEALPFGLQNELLKLAAAIQEKLNKSQHQQVLRSLK